MSHLLEFPVRRRSFLRMFVLLWFGAVTAPVQSGELASSAALTVMTYNLRYASTTPPNAWPQRRPLVREVITNTAPDVIGTQEGLSEQLRDLAADLPEYDWIGVGRDGGSKGEFMAVFYRRARLEALATNHFWLSDTPEVAGSKTWGPKFARMVTWVKFRDRTTKQEFYVFNTHFDHEVQAARERSAELIRKRVAALEPKLPVLLIGDFNAAAGANQAYDILTGAGFFADAWKTALVRRGEGIGTFNDFKGIERNGARIDWVLTRGAVVVDRAETISFQRDGQFPSDHFPVVTQLRLVTSP
jgi:endonuclease/exonuclease/phosphatase family metal-dependent hydrolase